MYLYLSLVEREIAFSALWNYSRSATQNLAQTRWGKKSARILKILEEARKRLSQQKSNKKVCESDKKNRKFAKKCINVRKVWGKKTQILQKAQGCYQCNVEIRFTTLETLQPVGKWGNTVSCNLLWPRLWYIYVLKRILHKKIIFIQLLEPHFLLREAVK